MRDQRALAAVAVIVCVPVLFAALGGSQVAGLVLGAVLVVVGLVATLRGR